MELRNFHKIKCVFGRVLSVDSSSYDDTIILIISSFLFHINCKLLMDIEGKMCKFWVSEDPRPPHSNESIKKKSFELQLYTRNIRMIPPTSHRRLLKPRFINLPTILPRFLENPPLLISTSRLQPIMTQSLETIKRQLCLIMTS